jgi:Co/Zn/Cd efflux system component
MLETNEIESHTSLRNAVKFVAAANLAYFFVEFGIARRIGSVSLFADSIDFLEDAMVNLLILMALAWSATRRAQVGKLLSLILLVPGLAVLWSAWQKFRIPAAPEPFSLSVTGAGALAVNVCCALVLVRFRHHSGSLTRAAFLSARNDVFANVAIIAAGLLTVWVGTGWPDLVVGLGIAAMNADAASDVWKAAAGEAAAGEAAAREGAARS